MSLGERLKESFIDGMLLVLPFAAVIFIFNLLADWALIVVNPVVKSTRLVDYTSNIEVLAQIIAAISVFLIIVLLGLIYTSERSNGWRKKFGKFVNFIPLFGTIYLSVRQVASSIGENESRFKKLVIVEYPRDGIYSVGLLTSEAPNALQIKESQNLYSVFFPNSPNPTGGRTVMVPEEKVTEVDMSVQKGLKLMMTTGMAFEEKELPNELKDT